jgi:hypothetical protein
MAFSDDELIKLCPPQKRQHHQIFGMMMMLDGDVEFSNKIKFNSSLFARLARYGSRRAKRKSNANNQINLIMSHLNKLREE